MKVKNRVKKDKEFQLVIDEGSRYRVESLVLYSLKNSYSYPRIGISVPNKSGSAVIRNKIRRQIRAILAKELDFKISYDLVFIVRKKYDVSDFVKTRNDIIHLLQEVGK